MKRKNLTLILILLCFSLQIFSQTQPPFTKAETRLKSETQRKTLKENSLVANLEFRNVGPTVMSGQIVDV